MLISQGKNEDSIDLSVLLENEESIKFNITILDRIHNDSKSTIITLELRETKIKNYTNYKQFCYIYIVY